MEKVKPSEIVISGEIDTTARTFSGSNCWQDAQRFINSKALHFPKDGSYCKVDFKITFSDGQKYFGRLNATQDDHNLARHLNARLRYFSRSDLNTFYAKAASDFLVFATKYQITG